MHGYIKSEIFNNIQKNEIKNELFNFSAFINSCKDYKDIKELKDDLKIFFRNKNENIDYNFQIIYNYLKKILKIISTSEFFKSTNNIEILIKILHKLDKNLNFDSNINSKEYIEIQHNINQIYQLILVKFANNNSNEKISDYITKLIKNIENNSYNSSKINLSSKNNNNKITCISNVGVQEKENKNLNHIINDKKEKKELYKNYKKEINIMDKNEKNNNKNYNYENIMFPPIQNDDSYYK